MAEEPFICKFPRKTKIRVQDYLKSEETIGCGANGGGGNEMSHVTFLGTPKISAMEINAHLCLYLKNKKLQD